MNYKKTSKTDLIKIMKDDKEKIIYLENQLKEVSLKYDNLVNNDDSNVKYLKQRISQTQNEKRENYITALEKYLQ
tara:strand:+ start:3283 stop:3507 length:225 start_codon:yes stop_codon:yes gene_type:complete